MTITAKIAATRENRPDAEAIFEAIADALLLIDGEDVIRAVNPAAEQFFAASETYLSGSALGDLVQFDSPLIALAAKARDGFAAITEYNLELLSPRNEPRVVDAQMTAMADYPGWVLLALRMRSIAHKLDRQLSHLGAGRSVAGLAATLAHEVKNPLAGIRGAAQLLERDLDLDGLDLTRLITEETDRICALVDRLEVFSSGYSLERAPVNIHQVLDQVRRAAESGFARGVRFIERYDPSLPAVSGNYDDLLRVFLNLVKNASEALPSGGEAGEITLTTAYRTGLRQSAPGGDGKTRLPLMVSIQDNGGGIPPALQEHLFEPFITSKAGGTGLGLALVAKTIGDHGGVIEFTSEPGRTVFHVMLPLHHGEDGAPYRGAP